MSNYYAEIDDQNLVTRVIVAKSLQWCVDNLSGKWVQTFKDRSQRYNYASVGFEYDPDRDAFIPPKPFESWVLNEETCLYEAPVAYPEDGNDYVWDEETTSWVVVPE